MQFVQIQIYYGCHTFATTQMFRYTIYKTSSSVNIFSSSGPLSSCSFFLLADWIYIQAVLANIAKEHYISYGLGVRKYIHEEQNWHQILMVNTDTS